ncbi:MAG: hypothetical protein WCC14_22285 [Acidobacteriaceae bacterium]
MRDHLISFALSFISESASALPDPVRLELAAESAKWFRDLLISGGVVAFGCLLEIWETAVSLRNWFRARRGLAVKENPRSWGIPIAAVGLLLVVGGVVGEVVYEGLSSNADIKLQSHESDVLSDAETKAGQANDRASQNEKEAAQLHKDAEDERLARVKIEAAVGWRSLSNQQKRDIGAALASFSPRAGVSIWFNASSTEAEMFADDIADALRLGHITTSAPGGMIEMGEGGKWNGEIKSVRTGVIIQSTKAPAAIELAAALIRELTSRGFDAKRETDPPFDPKPEPIVWVNVEARPRGPQGEYKLHTAKSSKQMAK